MSAYMILKNNKKYKYNLNSEIGQKNLNNLLNNTENTFNYSIKKDDEIEILTINNDDINEISLFNLLSLKISLNILNLKKYTNLKTLYCCSNGIKELILHENIENLYCSNNNLKNIPNNLCNIKILGCSNNNINKIDESITNNLESLECSNNKINELIINSNNLFNLNCKNNELEYLDLQNNHNLKWLNYSNNNISNLILNNQNKSKLKSLVNFNNPDSNYNYKEKYQLLDDIILKIN